MLRRTWMVLACVLANGGCAGSNDEAQPDGQQHGLGSGGTEVGASGGAQSGGATAEGTGGRATGGSASGGNSAGNGGTVLQGAYCERLDDDPAGVDAVVDGAVSVATGQELSQAISSALDGSTIVVEDGTYENIVETLSATSVMLRARNPGRARLTGTSTLTIEGSGNTVAGFVFENGEPESSRGAIFLDGNNHRASNIVIAEYNAPDTKWLSVRGQDHEVDHCLFTGKNTLGALLTVWRDDSTSDRHHIHHNFFRDYESGGGENGYETIRLGTSDQSQSDSESRVECNLFLRCDGEIEIVSVKSGANVIRANTVIESAGQLTSRHGKGNLFEDNVILTGGVDGGGGIRLFDEGHTVRNNYVEGVRASSSVRGGIVLMAGATTRTISSTGLNGAWTFAASSVERNTIVNSQDSFVYGPAYDNSPWDVAFTENVVRNDMNGDGQFPIVDERQPIDQPTYDGDLYYGSALGISLPAGVSNDYFELSQNEDGLWLHPSAGAQGLSVLSGDDVGPSFDP